MSCSLRRYLASKLANQGEGLNVGTLWVKLFISPLPNELQKQLKKSYWDLTVLKAGLFLASSMTSLARLLQVVQGATEILGQQPLEDPWCCGAGRTWAQSQLSATPQAPMQNPQGRQWVLLATPYKPAGIFCSSEEMNSKDEHSAFRVQVGVACSVLYSFMIKIIIGLSQGTVQYLDQQVAFLRHCQVHCHEAWWAVSFSHIWLFQQVCRTSKSAEDYRFLLECLLSDFSKCFFRLCPSWKHCLIFTIIQNELVLGFWNEECSCYEPNPILRVLQLVVTAHLKFKLPLYSTEVERVVTQIQRLPWGW